ncbi:MAG: alkaline phosphatase family protein [Gracilibacteraceae bacterium]|nr:alkaline phosphatase family protein [Gracilibacteraceae bacterium]
MKEAATKKMLILGVDGLDPRFTRYMLDKGELPNIRKYLARGAAREDLVMLGGHPTGTPPMWTTLATGCYANVHGITCFNLASERDLDYFDYAFDSRRCKAEQLWNVTAAAGRKTLVFHWPGSSWPPSGDSANLHVVDGSQPAGVNMGLGEVDIDYFIVAATAEEQVRFVAKGEIDGVAPCNITGMEVQDTEKFAGLPTINRSSVKAVVFADVDGTNAFSHAADLDYARSPIKEADGWAAAPPGAKEFVLLFSKGLVRRPGLILQDENGVFNRVAFYRSKKDAAPLAVLPLNVYVPDIVDEVIKDDERYQANRSFRLLELAPDGSALKIFVSAAVNIAEKSLFSPPCLHGQLVEAAGYPPAAPMFPAISKVVAEDCLGAQWDHICAWQSRAIQGLIGKNGYDVVFSHLHNVDAQAHMLIRHMKKRSYSLLSEVDALAGMERVYRQTDEYLGSFLHYLDEGWTVFIVSDHALVCPEFERPMIGDPIGINVGLLRELGFTEVLKDENQRDKNEIDWTKTRAVASRANQIYLNLKGKYAHGIVNPEDQYELEEEIITALYGYKHPQSGKRVISVALRNRDAVLLGYGGADCGEIVCWTADGYNDDHFDGLSTVYGLNHTSLSPLFIAAGVGIKPGCVTTRVIRQVDFVPTVATLCGVRMPEQCEGAPIYQILTAAD